MSKVGKKYVIEIDREYKDGVRTLYGIKGFTSLVFDEYGIEKLVPEEILTSKEKEYLRAVIKPFREHVKHIKLGTYGNPSEFHIAIVLDDDAVNLPDFKSRSMYRGMRLNRAYSLEELDL